MLDSQPFQTNVVITDNNGPIPIIQLRDQLFNLPITICVALLILLQAYVGQELFHLEW